MANDSDENSTVSWTQRMLSFSLWFGAGFILSLGAIYVAVALGAIALPSIPLVLLASALISSGMIGIFSVASLCVDYFYPTPSPVVQTHDDKAKQLRQEVLSSEPKQQPHLTSSSSKLTSVTDMYTLQTRKIQYGHSHQPTSTPAKPPSSPRNGTLKSDEEDLSVLRQFQDETRDPKTDEQASTLDVGDASRSPLRADGEYSKENNNTEKGAQGLGSTSVIAARFLDGEGAVGPDYNPAASSDCSGVDAESPITAIDPSFEDQTRTVALQQDNPAASSDCSGVMAASHTTPVETGSDCSGVFIDYDTLDASVNELTDLHKKLRPTDFKSPKPNIAASIASVNKFIKRNEQLRRPLHTDDETDYSISDLIPTISEREEWRKRQRMVDALEKQRSTRNEYKDTPSKEERAEMKALETRRNALLAAINSLTDLLEKRKAKKAFKNWKRKVYAVAKKKFSIINAYRKREFAARAIIAKYIFKKIAARRKQNPVAPVQEKDAMSLAYQHPDLFPAEYQSILVSDAPSPPQSSETLIRNLNFGMLVLGRKLQYAKEQVQLALEQEKLSTRKKLTFTDEKPVNGLPDGNASECSGIAGETDKTESATIKSISRNGSSECSGIAGETHKTGSATIKSISRNGSSECSGIAGNTTTESPDVSSQTSSGECSDLRKSPMHSPRNRYTFGEEKVRSPFKTPMKGSDCSGVVEQHDEIMHEAHQAYRV